MRICNMLCVGKHVKIPIWITAFSPMKHEYKFSTPLCITCWVNNYGKWTTEGYIMHVPLARYVKLRFAHAPGMPGTFSPPPWVCDPDMHHGTCVTYVRWCMPGSLTGGFLWNCLRGKRSRHLTRGPWRSKNQKNNLAFVEFFDRLVTADFTTILYGYFTGTGAIIRLPQCQWNKHDNY